MPFVHHWADALAMSNARYISLQDAHQYLGLSVKTLRRRIADGSLPAYKPGGRLIRVRTDDLDLLMRRIPNGTTR